ncbi:MAG TPA: peptidoglycan editing factor PgeF [Myxococcales bacterium]|nr:peptidoglycan editing factor PgeF [Myxococcales bacterium]
MMWLRSKRLEEAGFRHAFSTREGGVSEGPFASLNLARTVGDDPAAVAENARRFEAALECDRLYEVSQVHGRAVERVSHEPVAEIRRREADALVTSVAGAAVAVRTADCVPILLADPASGAVAAVHAGWRGVAQNILRVALEELGAADPIAAIGPHIRLDAFEVGPEVAAEIARAVPGARVVEARAPRPHVDLAAAVRAQLAEAGVTEIDDVGGCTHAEPARFFSHRRDAGKTGRHLSAIVARARTSGST